MRAKRRSTAKIRSLGLLIAILALALGCDSPDARLARLAEHHAEAQRKQNDFVARQSELVVQESHQLAETAKELVARDAQARQELIAAQRQLNQELHAERGSLDRQREAMEQERKALAQQRHRDPLLAAAIETVGLLLACLVPLLLAAYALWQLNHGPSGNDELGELFLGEFTAEKPLLLSGGAQPRALPGPTVTPNHPLSPPNDPK